MLNKKNMIIFEVYENYQEYDNDGLYHWIAERSNCLCTSEEIAEEMILSFGGNQKINLIETIVGSFVTETKNVNRYEIRSVNVIDKN